MNDKVAVFVASCGHLVVYQPTYRWETMGQPNTCLACIGAERYTIHSHLDKQRIAWNKGDA